MPALLLRRFLHGIFLLWGVSVLSFALFQFAPGDPLDELRLNPRISERTVAELRAWHKLDAPLPLRYLSWLRSVARGEMGYSIAYDRPVAPLVWERAGNTLLLGVTATALAWLLALIAGVWCAAGGRWRRLAFNGTIPVLIAIPDLILALGLLFLAVRTGWFPLGDMTSPGAPQLGLAQKAGDMAVHLVLPVSALVLGAVPMLASHVRTAMSEVLERRFIFAARAHGISRRRLLLRHALPAAANPLISLLGTSIGTLLSASLLVEAVMSWPGLGNLLLQAILQRDYHLVLGAVLMSTVFLAAGNLIADVLLYRCDPRIRVER